MHLKNVFGLKVKIVSAPIGDKGLDGLYLPNEAKILMDETLSEYDFKRTLIHEFGHALLYRMGLYQTDVSDDILHMIIDSYATALLDNFDIKLKK